MITRRGFLLAAPAIILTPGLLMKVNPAVGATLTKVARVFEFEISGENGLRVGHFVRFTSRAGSYLAVIKDVTVVSNSYGPIRCRATAERVEDGMWVPR